MRSKLIVGIGASTLLFGTTIAMLRSVRPYEPQNPGLEVPVLVSQLPVENGVIPVELRCDKARLAAPDTLERVPCVVKNNTNKSIRALATQFTVVVDYTGKESPDTGFLTLETSLHADLNKAHMHKLIMAGQEQSLEPSPATYERGIVKRVELRMDYVEFDDNSTLGPDKNGSKLITLGREGAAKYKEWLLKKYTESGKSVDAIASLINAKDLPDELEFRDMNQAMGAKQYRAHLREIYATNGAAELKKYFDR